MPGTPPTSPRFGAPRYSDADPVRFSDQVNAIADTFDEKAALTGQAFMVGGLQMSAAQSPPDGWLRCDGSAVSRATYSDLFLAISTTYGAGDGSTTFNVPDFRGKTIVGAGQDTTRQLTSRKLGDYSGAETHQLTAAESGTNGAGATDPFAQAFGGYFPRSQGHWTFSRFTPAGTGPYGVPYCSTAGTEDDAGSTVSGATSLATRNADSAHNNMQPYGVANVFIYAGV